MSMIEHRIEVELWAHAIENYANNKSIEKVKSSDSDIIIVYSNFPLKYYYGYISIDQEENYGIYCANTNFENYIYPIDNEMLTIIDKYGEWY